MISRSKGRIWQAHEGKQAFALSRTEDEIGYGGARGGGKTDAGMAFLMRPYEHPLYRGLALRRNYQDMVDWIDRAELFYAGLGAVKKGNPAVFHFPSGARIRCGHLADKNAYTKYQGHEYQRLLAEELTQIPSEDLWEAVLSSNRSTIEGVSSRAFTTFNPGGPGHLWVKRRYVDPEKAMRTIWGEPQKSGLRLSRIFIPATVDDNPTLMKLDPKYIAFLDSIKDPNLRKAWRDGSWEVFDAKGAYYSRLIKLIQSRGQVNVIPYHPDLPVHTAWDLGVGRNMRIWFFQMMGTNIHVIDYMAGESEGMLHYIQRLKNPRYRYSQYANNWGMHFAPHDLEHPSGWDAETRMESAAAEGFNFEVLPKFSVDEGIDMVSKMLPYCSFDKEKTEDGVYALQNYKQDYSEKLMTFRDKPSHDWASHAADAFRYLCVGVLMFLLPRSAPAQAKQKGNLGSYWENSPFGVV